MRNHQWLAACQVTPESFAPVLPRLDPCMTPLVTLCQGQVAEPHAHTSGGGLLSNLARHNGASMAYRFGPSRLPWHAFMGGDAWDAAPGRSAGRSPVQRHVGQGDGGLGCAPAGVAKAGHEAVGVATQGCGRLGPGDHGPVAMYLGYVSSKGHTLVAQRLFLPKEWTKAKARLDKAGVPTAYRAYRTRHQLALEMLAKKGAGLPHGWMSGDAEMGRPYWFRRRLATLGERYWLAVPSHTAMRDLETAPPE